MAGAEWQSEVFVQRFFLVSDSVRRAAADAVAAAPDGFVVEIRPRTRSLEQNSRMWSMLTDVSQQIDWYRRRLSPEDWKHIFTAELENLDTVPGISGGIVVLGQSTRKMSVKKMSDLIELIDSFGAEHGVKFKDNTGEMTWHEE